MPGAPLRWSSSVPMRNGPHMRNARSVSARLRQRRPGEPRKNPDSGWNRNNANSRRGGRPKPKASGERTRRHGERRRKNAAARNRNRGKGPRRRKWRCNAHGRRQSRQPTARCTWRREQPPGGEGSAPAVAPCISASRVSMPSKNPPLPWFARWRLARRSRWAILPSAWPSSPAR